MLFKLTLFVSVLATTILAAAVPSEGGLVAARRECTDEYCSAYVCHFITCFTASPSNQNMDYCVVDHTD